MNSNGKDQNEGIKQLKSKKKKSLCWEDCMAHLNARGCEFNMVKKDCIYHTKDVAKGQSGEQEYRCLVLEKNPPDGKFNYYEGEWKRKERRQLSQTRS